MEKDGWIKMFKVNAYVTEIEPDNLYEVDIDGFKLAVAANEGIDGGAVTFKSALTKVLELKYGDFDFICCGVKNGVCSYVVSIYDYVW